MKLEAERKLSGALYHLKRMEKFYLKEDEPFIYELEAFLVKVRGALDALLWDFNVKFKLGFKEEDRVDFKNFMLRACELGNEEALEFIKWWKEVFSKLRGSKFGFLFDKRNIAVHKKRVKPNLIQVQVTESLSILDSVTVTVYDKSGRMKENIEIGSGHRPSAGLRTSVEVGWFFKDYPGEDVLTLCWEFYNKVCEVVKVAKEKFDP